MESPIYVNWHTPNYAETASRLRLSLDEFRLPREIVELPNLGTWRRNVRRKPEFIISMLEKYRRRPVVWIDADAEIKVPPVLLGGLFGDVAACRWTWPDRPITEVMTNLVYFAPTPLARRFARRWADAMSIDPYLSDQPVFNSVLARSRDIHFESLPISYSYILGIHDRFWPEVTPVIVQHQRSRQEDKSKL